MHFLHKVRVVISSDVPHTELFLREKNNDTSDENRALMDDLNITAESVSIQIMEFRFLTE